MGGEWEESGREWGGGESVIGEWWGEDGNGDRESGGERMGMGKKWKENGNELKSAKFKGIATSLKY